MKKIQLLMLALAGFVVTSRAADGFADSVVSYDPGTGYVAGFTNVSAVLGEPSTINPYGEATDVFDPPYGTDQSSPSARAVRSRWNSKGRSSSAQPVRH